MSVAWASTWPALRDCAGLFTRCICHVLHGKKLVSFVDKPGSHPVTLAADVVNAAVTIGLSPPAVFRLLADLSYYLMEKWNIHLRTERRTEMS
jgi:hypothetical protein